jgi:uncharacterized protein (TIGR02186 family)
MAQGKGTILVATAMLAVSAVSATAERLVASISNHRVMVTSNFAGDELVLFGGIEDTPSVPRPNSYDIVVTVIGPRQNMVVFRKERVLGIWVNYDSREFENAPAYFATLSNRPLEAIANGETLRRLQLGLNNLVLLQRASIKIADSAADDPFRQAFLRLKSDNKLYGQQSNGVTLLTQALFRASIPLPAEVPVGNYQVEVKLFSGGSLITREPSAFEVYKAGFEQVITRAAREQGLLYGFATAMMALATGWLASVVFRRD